MANNNTITWKDVNPAAYGKALHTKFRNAVNTKIYRRSFIINRIDITWNKETKQYEEDRYLTIVADSPLIEEFGYDPNYREYNVKVFDLDEDKKKSARRVNVDGDKYFYCDSIIAIEAEKQDMIDKLADEGYTLDVTKYMAATASPSNEKHAVKYYAKMLPGMTEDDIFDHVDNLMGGALSDNLMTKLVDGRTIGKANTRIGNYASGMQCLAEIDLAVERIAVVRGSIFQAYDFSPAVMEMMKEVGVEIDNKINDGAGFVIPEKIMEMAANVGVKLTYEAALRIAIQTRWDVVNTKIMAQVRPGEVLEDMADFYGAEIYGNPNGPIVALVDKDGAKMINWSALKDGNTVIKMYVMAVANASGVKSCNQHLIKYMSVNPERTLELAAQYATEAVDDFVVNKLEDKDGQGFTVNGRIMAKLDANEVYSDSILMETLFSETETYVKTMIAENKIPLEGQYTHMTFDTSYAMTRGQVEAILRKTAEGFIEAYSPDVLETYAEEIAEIENDPNLTEAEKDHKLFILLSATVIKFPSAMPDEYEVIVYKTNRQMRRRIKETVAELQVSNKEKQRLIDLLNNYIKFAAWGCTIYAPINAMKNKLAGADIDFDATMCDMSEFKHILVEARMEEAQKQPGYMGNCTFIKYGEFEAKQQPKEEKAEETVVELEDLDIM